jgi:hypothetical protein
MIWQDFLIFIANIIFAVSLIIQVYYGFKEKAGPIKFQASIPTMTALYAISIAFWSLALYFSAIVSFFNGTMWFLLFIQRLSYNKK